MMTSTGLWLIAGFVLHLAGAVACTAGAAWLVRGCPVSMPYRRAMVGALLATALWCVAMAALGAGHRFTLLAEIARNLGWVYLVYRLFAADGRHHAIAAIRPVAVALAFVEVLQLMLALVARRYGLLGEIDAVVFEIGAMFRILMAVGALVLLHNLYAGAAPDAREVLRWPAAGLGVLWAYELNLYTIAYLGGGLSPELLALRGLLVAIVAATLALGSNAAVVGKRLSPSRMVAFRSLSLLVIGAYFALMVGLAYSFNLFGDDMHRLAQVGLVFAAAVVALLWLPSRRMRGWWRVTVIKHLFQHRYDYRVEWLRFTRTMGQAGPAREALPERAIHALADITDSPSGLLLMPGDGGALTLAARWRWPQIAVPPVPLPQLLAAVLEREGYILDLDQVRAGECAALEAAALPEWLEKAEDAWAIVPLLHFDRLTGVIVLARPGVARRLDWEDFDLLRTVGRTLASYLAESAGQEALMEAAQFDAFSRRIAFVMHDIKNLASQLSLLARNAEMHADKPEFRADMLVTLRNSADKLNALLARLGRYGPGGGAKSEDVDLGLLAERVRARLGAPRRVHIVGGSGVVVRADGEALEQALVHLVQNALDASDDGAPVHLDMSSDAMRGKIEVIDAGCGMSAEFVRTGLFKPFVSSKQSGFGIGAFEARELVRAMGGRLDVDSREGIGTRFAISLPLAAIASLLDNAQLTDDAEVA